MASGELKFARRGRGMGLWTAEGAEKESRLHLSAADRPAFAWLRRAGSNLDSYDFEIIWKWRQGHLGPNRFYWIIRDRIRGKWSFSLFDYVLFLVQAFQARQVSDAKWLRHFAIWVRLAILIVGLRFPVRRFGASALPSEAIWWVCVFRCQRADYLQRGSLL